MAVPKMYGVDLADSSLSGMRMLVLAIYIILEMQVMPIRGQIYAERDRCAGLHINLETTLCCRGLVYDRQGALRPACCGSVAYDDHTHICCENQIHLRTGPTTRCCGNNRFDSSNSLCVGRQVRRRALLGSTCCVTSRGWKCCRLSQGCCAGLRSEQVEVPGFRPVCCDIQADATKARCCSAIVQRTGLLPDCCAQQRVRPICCENRLGGFTCCPNTGTTPTCCLHTLVQPTAPEPLVRQTHRPRPTTSPTLDSIPSCCGSANPQIWCCKTAPLPTVGGAIRGNAGGGRVTVEGDEGRQQVACCDSRHQSSCCRDAYSRQPGRGYTFNCCAATIRLSCCSAVGYVQIQTCCRAAGPSGLCCPSPVVTSSPLTSFSCCQATDHPACCRTHQTYRCCPGYQPGGAAQTDFPLVRPTTTSDPCCSASDRNACCAVVTITVSQCCRDWQAQAGRRDDSNGSGFSQGGSNQGGVILPEIGTGYHKLDEEKEEGLGETAGHHQTLIVGDEDESLVAQRELDAEKEDTQMGSDFEEDTDVRGETPLLLSCCAAHDMITCCNSGYAYSGALPLCCEESPFDDMVEDFYSEGLQPVHRLPSGGSSYDNTDQYEGAAAHRDVLSAGVEDQYYGRSTSYGNIGYQEYLPSGGRAGQRNIATSRGHSELRPVCNGLPYEEGVFMCCDGYLRLATGLRPACCATQAYDMARNMCCDGIVKRTCGV